MLINKILNAFMDSRNLGREFNGKKALNKLEFISGRYHVLREICQKFSRISSVKWTSLYLQSRAGPAEKYASRVHNTKLWLGPKLQHSPNQKHSNNSLITSTKNMKY